MRHAAEEPSLLAGLSPLRAPQSDQSALDVTSATAVTRAELHDMSEDEIRHEFDVQEALIRGYEKENKRLLASFKELERSAKETKERLMHENARLSLELSNAGHSASSAEGAARLRAELDHEAALLALREELAEARAESAETVKRLSERLEAAHREIGALRDARSASPPPPPASAASQAEQSGTPHPRPELQQQHQQPRASPQPEPQPRHSRQHWAVSPRSRWKPCGIASRNLSANATP